MNIHFERASLEYKDTVMEWLQKPHVLEFWDNSPEHKADIVNFMHGRIEPSPYYDGMFDYWLGFIDHIPYCLIMTSLVSPEEDLPPEWLPCISNTGKTFSLDFMIGNELFLGKGLGATTLSKFMSDLQNRSDALIDTFIIDPETNNLKAIHIYKKAGFAITNEFDRDGKTHYLMIKKAPF